MTQKVSHYDELYPGRFLKSGEISSSPTYTIKDVYLDKLENDKGKEQPKGVIAFKEVDQELTLNKTNGECIKAMFGDMVPNWIGKRIQLVKGKDKFGADMVDAIRIGGSPDIDKDINVHVTYRRRKARDFTLKSLKNGKGKTELTPDHASWDKVIAAVKDGYTRDQVEEKYIISDENWNQITGENNE